MPDVTIRRKQGAEAAEKCKTEVFGPPEERSKKMCARVKASEGKAELEEEDKKKRHEGMGKIMACAIKADEKAQDKFEQKMALSDEDKKALVDKRVKCMEDIAKS